MAADDEPLIDEDAGRLVRPYTVSNGRTAPTRKLDLMSLVASTGRVGQGDLSPEYARTLRLCKGPTSVAEVAAHLRLPAAVTKVLLSDLVDAGAVAAQAPGPTADPSDGRLLEILLDGLQRRL
ncbi:MULTISPECIES: DUF742 domain-containing protein [Nocardiopsis]|uniref:DUF742 domain-containing protein n=1 Tax=Nocardiopsis TaxID=2013 RepID=UPI00034DF8DF|nr:MULTISPECIES: DUF742 domain-containing protein [Nocardiopsis]